MFWRILIFVTLVYFLYRILNRFRNTGSRPPKQPRIKRTTSVPQTPPPYDPDDVEDIDYTDVKKKD